MNPVTRRACVALAALLGLCAQGAEAQEIGPAALKGRAEKERKAGNYPRAIELYEQMLRLSANELTAVPDPVDFEWRARSNLALSYALAGQTERALELDKQNLEFARRHRDALTRGPMNREIDTLQGLAGDYLWLRDYTKALEALQAALALEAAEGDQLHIGLLSSRLHQNLGVVQILAGQPEAGERTLYKSLELFDRALKARAGADRQRAYEHETEVEVLRWLQSACITKGQVGAALELAERGRAREFAALLGSRVGVAGRDFGPGDHLSLQQLKEVAASQRSTVVEFSVQYEYNPRLALQFSEYSKIPATDIFAWIIRPSGEVLFERTRLDPPLMLADLVRSSRETLGAVGRGVGGVRPSQKPGEHSAAMASLRRLHELLIEPISSKLPSEENAPVTFIPQDFLFLVPFAALRDKDGRFMVERFTITTAPSIEVLGLARQFQAALPADAQGALIVGNPVMPMLAGVALPDLPGAEKEAGAIAEMLGTHALTGPRATKQAVIRQIGQARLVHLATHGLLDDAGGAMSSLVFASADGDDGLLRARDILQMRLHAELAVLSACDTGQGTVTGDGVVGLARSLMAAGVSSVVVSLWGLPDASGSLLMTSFYKELQGGADKASALRLAMLTTMKQHPEPLDWAGITLIGVPDVSPGLQAAFKNGLSAPR